MGAFSDWFPAALGILGLALGLLLVVIYLGRLIILDPADSVVPAGVAVNTVWYVCGWAPAVARDVTDVDHRAVARSLRRGPPGWLTWMDGAPATS